MSSKAVLSRGKTVSIGALHQREGTWRWLTFKPVRINIQLFINKFWVWWHLPSYVYTHKLLYIICNIENSLYISHLQTHIHTLSITVNRIYMGLIYNECSNGICLSALIQRYLIRVARQVEVMPSEVQCFLLPISLSFNPSWFPEPASCWQSSISSAPPFLAHSSRHCFGTKQTLAWTPTPPHVTVLNFDKFNLSSLNLLSRV